MLLLALDTATRTGSAAVWQDGRVLSERRELVTTHSERLLAIVSDVLGDAQKTLPQIDGVAVGAGPGSFTGLRIGMATAKGLCFALDKPLYAVSSLAALALGARAHASDAGAPVLACLDALRDEVFVGIFAPRGDIVVPLLAEFVLAPEAVGAYLARHASAWGHAPLGVIGNGAERYEAIAARWGRRIGNAAQIPAAAHVAALAAARDASDNVAAIVPSYVRLSEAETQFGK